MTQSSWSSLSRSFCTHGLHQHPELTWIIAMRKKIVPIETHPCWFLGLNLMPCFFLLWFILTRSLVFTTCFVCFPSFCVFISTRARRPGRRLSRVLRRQWCPHWLFTVRYQTQMPRRRRSVSSLSLLWLAAAVAALRPCSLCRPVWPRATCITHFSWLRRPSRRKIDSSTCWKCWATYVPFIVSHTCILLHSVAFFFR